MAFAQLLYKQGCPVNISLRQIRYFIAVASAQSVSAGARDLGISQSTVTTSLRQLEEEVGATLLIRTARGVSLTHEGHQFLRHARRIMGAVTDAGHAVRAGSESVSGSLNLGVTSMVAGYYLADLLQRYRRVFPKVNVRVTEDDRSYVEHLLINGELDIAILVTTNLDNRDALVAETLMKSTARIWLPVNHPLGAKEEIALAEAASEPVIMLTADEMDELSNMIWRRANLRPNVFLRTSSVEAVRSLVGTGAGIALLPDMAYRPWSLEGDRVEIRSISDEVPSVEIGLTWRRGSHMPETVKSFIELAREHSKTRERHGVRRSGSGQDI